MRLLKLLAVGLGALALSACSMLSYLTPRQFDPVEYGEAISVVQYATRIAHSCTAIGTNDLLGSMQSTLFLDQLNTHSMYLQEYTAHKKDNEDAAKGALQVRALVLEFDKHDQMTQRYCVEKASNIQSAARTLSRSLGREGKYDYCKEDLKTAFDRLKGFHDNKQLTDAEFAELGNDMVRLAKVNVSACGLLDRERIETAIAVIQKALPLLTGL